jgi:hypothetical protein
MVKKTYIMIVQFDILRKKNQNIKCIMTNQLGICPRVATTPQAKNTKQVIRREILESSDKWYLQWWEVKGLNLGQVLA